MSNALYLNEICSLSIWKNGGNFLANVSLVNFFSIFYEKHAIESFEFVVY